MTGRCAYCFRYPRKTFFSSYIHHIIENDSDDVTIPVFCNEYCMLRWAAIRKNMSIEYVQRDFGNFCGVQEMTDNANHVKE